MLGRMSTHSLFFNLQEFSFDDVVQLSNNAYLDKKHHLLFTDGSFSKQDYSVGYGIHLQTCAGERFNFFDGEIEHPIGPELPSFSQMYFEDIALNKGLKECARLGIKGVVVFLDAKSTYRRFCKAIKVNKLNPLELKDVGGRNDQDEYVLKLTKLWAENRELFYQLSVQKVYLIRGHANIYGNVEADSMATKGRLLAIKKAS